MNKYTLGDYGRFDFILKKKGISTCFNLCATVMDIDGKYILICDNDEISYLVRQSDIKSFAPEKKPAIEVIETNK